MRRVGLADAKKRRPWIWMSPILDGPSVASRRCERWLREPLLHVLLIGVALFVRSMARSIPAPASARSPIAL